MSRLSITNAHIFDPASGFEDHGTITIEDGHILEFGAHVPINEEHLDAGGLMACPGLIDMRVTTGEPGREGKETLYSAGRAAASGGVTTMIVTPDTKPVIDDVSLIDYVARRAERDCDIHVKIAAALTKELDGKTLTEIGLLSQAGAVMFSDGPNSLPNAQIMRRALSYGTVFNALISSRAAEPSLTQGTCAHESDLSARLGLPGAPPAAERIMVDRDIALTELTGGRILIDMISCADVITPIKRAKQRGLDVACSVSINHLALNENDIGDYRSFAKLAPPLRSEQDRQALLTGINDGIIDVIVSGHDPHPAGEKRLPYADAAAGAIGLETLLSAGLSQVADGALDLRAFLAAVTCNPADLLGLPSGRIAVGAPADIILFDPHKPWVCDKAQLLSKSKNTPFDGRRMTGRVIKTFVNGHCIFER